MKKIFFLCFLGIILFHFGQAQHRSVYFEKATFAESLEKAKSERKLVFLDTYTSWCSACKWMDKTTFQEDRVADFFNTHFINVKFDTEKGEGLEIKKRYPGIHSYPTYLILDVDGKELHRIVGGGLPDEFIMKVKTGIDPETCLATLTKKYKGGKRGREFVIIYLKALEIAGQSQEAGRIVSEYIRELGQNVVDSSNWFLFRDYMTFEPFCPEFALILEKKKEFIENNGADAVEKVIDAVLLNGAFDMFGKDEDFSVDDRERFRKMVNRNPGKDFKIISMILDLGDAKLKSIAKLIKVTKHELMPSELNSRDKYFLFENIQQMVLDRGNPKEKESLKEIFKKQVSHISDEQLKKYYWDLMIKFPDEDSLCR